MISDIPSSDEPCQIHVPTEAWSEKRKQLFETRVGALLKHPEFLLVYVPKDETKLQLVKPVDSVYHQGRIIQRINESKSDMIPTTWYTLSHFWGDVQSDGYQWHDIGDHMNDEHGKPVELWDNPHIRMRHEKRQPLLSLLKSHPDSYWWIDNFCVRSFRASKLMGSIYTCCSQCIAMVDCKPAVISQIHTMKNVDMNAYENMPFTAFLDQYEKLNYLVITLTQCHWWKRVWTWQEMVLPQEIKFMAETTMRVSEDSMLHVNDLYHLEAMLGRMLFVFMKNGSRPLHAPSTAFKELRYSRAFDKHRVMDQMDSRLLISLIDVFGRSSREALYAIDYIYGVLGVLPLDIPRMDQHIHNPNVVWDYFLSKLDEFLLEFTRTQFTNNVEQSQARLITITEQARRADLSAARNMADVYRNLLAVYDCVS